MKGAERRAGKGLHCSGEGAGVGRSGDLPFDESVGVA
jgi:hypothetical protein